MKTPHKVRFYYNGKRQRDIYPEDKPLYVLKYKVMKFFKTYGLLIVLVLAFGSGTWLHFNKPVESKYCDLLVVECD